MANDVTVDGRTAVSLTLHPQLEAFLHAQSAKSGRSLQAKIITLIGEAMEAAEIPPAPTNTPFVCTETLMAQKAERQDCGEKNRPNAKLWAERHVRQTGHNVVVSLYYDMKSEDWLERMPADRRAEIEELVADPGKAKGLAEQLLRELKIEKLN
ncbi:hypothetical protein [Caulobacter soli]|uniref:hypothetical protein n=1 Tax=Caulobacter soli TaxID=2708539 RepID=UPI0013E9ACD2|nr:hypothetical protein [Caulobacter soli]